MIPFTDWRPDLADLNGNFCKTARNVMPGMRSYQPFPSLAPYGSAVLAADGRGVTVARQTGNAWVIHAGTSTRLYRFDGSSWTDISRSTGGNYNVSPNQFWRFVQFGNSLIAVNQNDDPQVANIDSGANFTALGGSPPRARNVTVVNDFVVLSSLTNEPNKIRWSGLNNSAQYTIGTNLSDEQSFPDGGRVNGVAGGETGYVLQEYAIRRMRFLPGSDYVFTFERVVEGKGCLSPYGFATIGGVVYFVSEDGFYAYSGSGLVSIGSERVNKWFLEQADTTRLDGVQCVADPYRPRILWAFYSNSNPAAFDRLMVYDWMLDKWTYGEISAQAWGSAATAATTLDSITANIDTYPISLDSRSLEGGRPALVGINTNRRISFLEGSPLEATIETQEFQVNPGNRSLITAAVPSVDASSATVQFSSRERLADVPVWGAAAPISPDGRAYLMSSGRLHRARLTIPAGTNWSHALGIEIEAQPDGAV